MLPVLFTIGAIPITSFGVSLSLVLLTAIFIIWRLALVYEFNKEQIIDVCLLSFFGSLSFARIYYVIFNPGQFIDQSIHFDKIIFFNKYPGLSFWGAFIGGLGTVYLLSRRLKVSFWQIADIGIVGMFVAMAIGSLGCLLGSCQSGISSDLPFAITQVGLIGKRFPLQIFESFLYLLAFVYLWRKSLKFHISGKIFSLGLILLGGIKFVTEFFRGEVSPLYGFLTLGHLYALLIFIYGVFLYYKLSKRSFLSDLSYLGKLFISSKKRQVALLSLKRRWYNLRVQTRVTVQKSLRQILRKINVKSNPPKI